MCTTHATLPTRTATLQNGYARPGQYSELGERIDSDPGIDHCHVTAR
jgi:hypothetical protein